MVIEWKSLSLITFLMMPKSRSMTNKNLKIKSKVQMKLQSNSKIKTKIKLKTKQSTWLWIQQQRTAIAQVLISVDVCKGSENLSANTEASCLISLSDIGLRNPDYVNVWVVLEDRKQLAMKALMFLCENNGTAKALMLKEVLLCSKLPRTLSALVLVYERGNHSVPMKDNVMNISNNWIGSSLAFTSSRMETSYYYKSQRHA